MIRHAGFAATVALCLGSSQAMADCRQALALGLDVSGSVDLQEYRLQLDGLITALNDPEIVNRFLAMPQAPVTLMVYEWSGSNDQMVLVPWTPVRDLETLRDISASLAAAERRAASPGTALGRAMNYGAAALDTQAHCWKLTLDISGDGHSNFGAQPRDVKEDIGARGITINGLVIGADSPVGADRRQSDIAQLSAYFQTEVIVGTDAFVQTAIGFEDYADAMTRKLKRELEGLVLGRLETPDAQ